MVNSCYFGWDFGHHRILHLVAEHASHRGYVHPVSYTHLDVYKRQEMEDCFADNSTPEQELDAKLLESAVNSFIRSLPDDARKVFIGRYYFFDSVKTIASYCSISEANVKTVLYRTRQKLKDYLVKEGFEL